MYRYISALLSDRKGGEVFVCFGGYHFLYILLTALICAAVFIYARGRDGEKRMRTAKVLIDIVFGMYIADFFLMPFAYGEIDIEKLPFHACTATCVLCFLSRHNAFFEKRRVSFALVGLLSNLIYLIYPAGVMWHAVHPLCYRVVQTLLFHGMMTVYCLFTVVFDFDGFGRKKALSDLSVICCLTAWAFAGSVLYRGEIAGKIFDPDWFFTLRDPFGILQPDVGMFVMPVFDIVVFFLLMTGVRLLRHGAAAVRKKTKNGSKDTV